MITHLQPQPQEEESPASEQRNKQNMCNREYEFFSSAKNYFDPPCSPTQISYFHHHYCNPVVVALCLWYLPHERVGRLGGVFFGVFFLQPDDQILRKHKNMLYVCLLVN